MAFQLYGDTLIFDSLYYCIPVNNAPGANLKIILQVWVL